MKMAPGLLVAAAAFTPIRGAQFGRHGDRGRAGGRADRGGADPWRRLEPLVQRTGGPAPATGRRGNLPDRRQGIRQPGGGRLAADGTYGRRPDREDRERESRRTGRLSPSRPACRPGSSRLPWDCSTTWWRPEMKIATSISTGSPSSPRKVSPIRCRWAAKSWPHRPNGVSRRSSAAATKQIEKNRKSDATIRVVDAAGRPVAGVSIRAEQIGHDFLFGCNIYRLRPLHDDEARNAAYKKRFEELFNYATLGFYWRSYEPVSVASRSIDYTDKVVAWCRERGYSSQGASAVVGARGSGIRPGPTASRRPRCSGNGCLEIMRRYRGKIEFWEVVNEPARICRSRRSTSPTAGPGRPMRQGVH